MFITHCHSAAKALTRRTCQKRVFSLSASPNPTWKAGDGCLSATWKEAASTTLRKSWNMSETPTRDTYRLLTSAIIPRPIAFVSTVSEDATPNLAPFSYFSMVSSNPPMLSVSFSIPSRRKKDTRENILSTKEFTVNLISESFVEASNMTAVETSEPNEWLLSGLTMERSVGVKPACVKESAFAMECELYSHQDITPDGATEPSTTIVLGRIKHVHARESILQKDGITVDPSKLQPVARMGGMMYAKVTDGFEIARPSWKAVREQYREIVEQAENAIKQ